ncbi:alpha-hydroxy acid oxidase [Actinomadura madurae]|uniref:alpha-hydroxy acid oxidase n=1 Tax=Actinomadura madurae TaxID=1993 RepID=UPI0020D23B53|nr:alpha-hydroxy acid oxidase [Actinomadura madurae]MCQ0018055.1 alpha-hydroxy-acid oxidizing protein [Actinomadura madurae]
MLGVQAMRRRRLSGVLNHEDARRSARRVLPRLLFDYIDGGADDEVTLRRNSEAFDDLWLRPRMGEWTPRPVLATEVLGTELSMPVLTAPCGGMRLVHPAGDLAVARGAERAGVESVVPSGGGYSLDQVASASGPRWFQLYKFSDPVLMEAIVERARRSGYRVLVATIDTAIAGNRERDFRNGFSYNLRINAKSAFHLGPQMARRPGWVHRFWRDGMPFELPNTAGSGSDGRAMPITEMGRTGAESFSPTWRDVARLREVWDGPLAVKGVLTGDDARRAVDLGADAVVVSNHGGRQLDGVPAAIDALPEVVDAVGGSAEVLLDGGVRRGGDVVRAVALGARAVLVGRLVVWGLAAGGEPGVVHVLEMLRSQMIRTMCLMGCASVAELDAGWLRARRTD